MAFRVNFIENQKLLQKLAILLFVITFFILFIFEPFGDITHGFILSGILRITSYALTTAVVFYCSERFLKPLFIKATKSSIYLPVYWYLIEIILVAVAIFFCRTLWVGFENTTLTSFFLVLYRVIVIAIIPLTVIMLLIFNSNKDNFKPPETILKSTDKNAEYLKLKTNTILYLKSDENYTSVFFNNEKQTIKSKILRGSLSHFESELSHPFVRIHRAFIVNLNAIKHIDVNSQGGTIALNSSEIELRVSRTYASNFKEQWNALNSM